MTRAIGLLPLLIVVGCGTTRWSDTRRTATEQLLISDAVDRAVNQVDLSVLAGKTVYFDDEALEDAVDQGYVVGSLRQHLLAHGCYLKERRSEAEYVVEARTGAVGTDRHDLLYGMPATNLPGLFPLAVPFVPPSIPELPFAKRTDQMGVVKLAVFAYHRETGMPVWQSGVITESSRAKDIWVMGAGPFQKGTIYDGTAFAGQQIKNPLSRRHGRPTGRRTAAVDVTASRVFSPLDSTGSPPSPDAGTESKVELAVAEEPVLEPQSASPDQSGPTTDPQEMPPSQSGDSSVNRIRANGAPFADAGTEVPERPAPGPWTGESFDEIGPVEPNRLWFYSGD